MKFRFTDQHRLTSAQCDAETGIHVLTFASVVAMMGWKYENRHELINATVTTVTAPEPQVLVIEQDGHQKLFVSEPFSPFDAKTPGPIGYTTPTPIENQNPPQQDTRDVVIAALTSLYSKATAEGKSEAASWLEELRQYLMRVLLITFLFLPQITYHAPAGERIQRLDPRSHSIIHRIDGFRF